MKKPIISEMTLRQKIGQTGMPGPGTVIAGARRCGGFDKYFIENPFVGLYVDHLREDHEGNEISSPEELAGLLQETSDASAIPLLVTCDLELGARNKFPHLHRIPAMMSLGAAGSAELAYQRSYYYAKELKSCGINWAFGPVCDMLSNFFCVSGVRCLSDRPDAAIALLPHIVKGFQDAGVAATAKHYPGSKGDYRDSHFCNSRNMMTKEEWDNSYRKIWKAAVEAGVESIMVSHSVFPAVDSSYARGKAGRPSTASKKVIDILRKELGYQGVILTDAVSMKAIASVFDREDMYIECFNAGNDLILFCHDDYIDIMEKAVLDGRVSMERLDESVERILNLKEKVGLFDEKKGVQPLTAEENAAFDRVNYEISKKAITLINNECNMLPFDAKRVKKVTIINLSPYSPFLDELQVMVDAFEERGIQATLLECLKSKDELQRLSETEDIIIYACFLAQSRPQGMSFFSRPEDMNTLINGLSFGAEKSVVASFGAPSIYYNYFESANAYLNAYSSDAGTMRAFVDGILGEFTFTGKSPVELRPKFEKI